MLHIFALVRPNLVSKNINHPVLSHSIYRKSISVPKEIGRIDLRLIREQHTRHKGRTIFHRSIEHTMSAPSPSVTPERILVLIKPNAMQKDVHSEIMNRFIDKGFLLITKKIRPPNLELMERHYAEHKGKPFYPTLIEEMMSGPSFSIVFERMQAVHVGRSMLGKVGMPGTLRGDYGDSITANAVHVSDSIDSALREIELWFPEVRIE